MCLLFCQIVVIRDGRSVFSLPVEFEAHCVSIHPGQSEVAVGGPSVGLIIQFTCIYRFNYYEYPWEFNPYIRIQ